MIENYFKDILYLFGILIGVISGYRFKKIQEKAGETDNLIKYQSMYATFVKDYEYRYKVMQGNLDKLTKEVVNINLRNAVIIEEAQTWKKRFDEMESLYSQLQNLYDKLKKEFENYKKDHK